jgi:hypothetical protein
METRRFIEPNKGRCPRTYGRYSVRGLYQREVYPLLLRPSGFQRLWTVQPVRSSGGSGEKEGWCNPHPNLTSIHMFFCHHRRPWGSDYASYLISPKNLVDERQEDRANLKKAFNAMWQQHGQDIKGGDDKDVNVILVKGYATEDDKMDVLYRDICSPVTSFKARIFSCLSSQEATRSEEITIQ